MSGLLFNDGPIVQPFQGRAPAHYPMLINRCSSLFARLSYFTVSESLEAVVILSILLSTPLAGAQPGSARRSEGVRFGFGATGRAGNVEADRHRL